MVETKKPRKVPRTYLIEAEYINQLEYYSENTKTPINTLINVAIKGLLGKMELYLNEMRGKI